MSFLEAILFGLIQGFSEFIPVSSTAHIVILANILGISTPGLTFEIFLHLASLLAVMIYFWRDLLWLALGCARTLRILPGYSADDRVAFRFTLFLGVGTAITGVLGVLLSKGLGDGIKAPPVVAAGLLLTAVLLVVVERVQSLGKRPPESLSLLDATVIGLAQAVAVFPGVSRSGSTLIAGLFMKLSRETAVRFSFLLAIPVLLGSSALAMRDIQGGELAAIGAGALTVSFVVSFIASMASIVFLIRLLKQQRLYWFSIYLVLLAGYVIIWL